MCGEESASLFCVNIRHWIFLKHQLGASEITPFDTIIHLTIKYIL